MSDTRGIRELAEEFWDKWVNGPDGGESLFLTSSNPSRTVFSFAAAFAESIVEQCAKIADSAVVFTPSKDYEDGYLEAASAIAAAIRSHWQRGEQA